MDTRSMALIFLIVAVAVCAVIFVPLLLIWALNTLFPTLAIPVTWHTWAAMLFLSAVLTARASK